MRPTPHQPPSPFTINAPQVLLLIARELPLGDCVCVWPLICRQTAAVFAEHRYALILATATVQATAHKSGYVPGMEQMLEIPSSRLIFIESIPLTTFMSELNAVCIEAISKCRIRECIQYRTALPLLCAHQSLFTCSVSVYHRMIDVIIQKTDPYECVTISVSTELEWPTRGVWDKLTCQHLDDSDCDRYNRVYLVCLTIGQLRADVDLRDTFMVEPHYFYDPANLPVAGGGCSHNSLKNTMIRLIRAHLADIMGWLTEATLAVRPRLDGFLALAGPIMAAMIQCKGEW